MSSTETVPFAQIYAKISELFSDLDSPGQDSLAGEIASLCQIGSGVTDISVAQYEQGVKLLTMLKQGEAPTLLEAHHQLLGKVTEVAPRPESNALLKQIQAIAAKRAADIVEDVLTTDANVGGRVKDIYLQELIAAFSVALQQGAEKKQHPTGSSVSQRVDQLLGLPSGSVATPALPESQD